MSHEHAIALRIGPDLDGIAVGYDGTRLSFIAPKAFPPGQPLQLTLLAEGRAPLALSVRSLGSKRRADQSFDVQARLVSLARTARASLEQAFAAS
jgi:hypothetical protein